MADWGIFDQNGNAVVTADNLISFEYKQEWDLLNYPVEDGGFQTFNKVSIPFDVRMIFSSGGSFENRQALLDSVDRIAGDLNLYTVVTPEEIYPSVSVSHYDYKRTATDGATLIKVAIWVTQVNETGTAAASNTQQPSGADPVNTGQVQPQAPTAAQVPEPVLPEPPIPPGEIYPGGSFPADGSLPPYTPAAAATPTPPPAPETLVPEYDASGNWWALSLPGAVP